jgi:hypothetical protein
MTMGEQGCACQCNQWGGDGVMNLGKVPMHGQDYRSSSFDPTSTRASPKDERDI